MKSAKRSKTALIPLTGTPDYPGTVYRKGNVDTVGGDHGASIQALFNKTRCVPAIEVLSCLAAEERFMGTVSLRFIVAKYRVPRWFLGGVGMGELGRGVMG